MATNFPTSLQDLDATRGSSSQALNNPSHATHHALEDDTIEAIQTKLGVDNSAVTSSIDYLLKSTSSVSPGHKHVSAEITDLAPISSSTGVADAGKLVKTDASGKVDNSFVYPTVVRTYELADSPATWTKPSNLVGLIVKVWGGGGSGGGAHLSTARGGGGGGGGYAECFFKASQLGSTETVTIGAGGTGANASASAVSGNVGGTSSFGSLVTAYGGGGGYGHNGSSSAAGGGGGGVFSAGSTPSTDASNGGAGSIGTPFSTDGTYTADSSNAYIASGGGGGNVTGTAFGAGKAFYGGAGGGSISTTNSGTGGTSVYGGNGGNGNGSGNGVAGSVPGGGGGASKGGTTGAGGAGRVIVYEIY